MRLRGRVLASSSSLSPLGWLLAPASRLAVRAWIARGLQMRPHLLRRLLLLAAAALPSPADCRQGGHHAAPPPPKHHDKSGALTVALAVAASLLALVLLYLCAAIAVRRFRFRSRGAVGREPAASSSAASRAAAFLRRNGLQHHRPAFTYEQLRLPPRAASSATEGSVWCSSRTARPPAGRPAAVKRLHVPPSPPPSFPSASATMTKSFCNEVLILSFGQQIRCFPFAFGAQDSNVQI